MKNANVGSKKTFKTSTSRPTAGVPVRSGVKAGFTPDEPRDFGTGEKLHDIGKPGGIGPGGRF